MRLILCIFVLALPARVLIAQSLNSDQQGRARLRGMEVLRREQARSKADLCAAAESGGDTATQICLVKEGRATEQSYLQYVRSIKILLRLGEDASEVTSHLAFMRAEKSWINYREQSCASMATQWEGGSQSPVAYANCKLTLTWNHMEELADLYSDLWH